jgi:uncharacterized protein (DUF1800 family)
MNDAVIALNRFGLGARPGDFDRVGSNPRAWLLKPFETKDAFLLKGDDLLSSQQSLKKFADYRMGRQDVRALPEAERPQRRNGSQNRQRLGQAREMAPAAAPDMAPDQAAIVANFMRLGRETLAVDTEARTERGLTVDNGFPERWVRFWSNWFTVAAVKAQTIALAGPFEREAIRPHVTDTFADLLVASSTHPGMLLYLDQAQSIGPNSMIGERRDAGLNENLAREIMELHTVGPDSGYSQADVNEFARALTGLTIVNPRFARFYPNAEIGTSIFVAQMHEPGARKIMGKTYPATASAQHIAILRDFAAHPSTAKRVANRLARAFVSDNPPQSLVDRLEASFTSTGGNLSALATALVTSPEAWDPSAAKFKTPDDFLTSSLRAAGAKRLELPALRASIEQLGQPPFRAPSPKGWPDDAASWAGPDAILKRADWANQLAGRMGDGVNPVSFAQSILGISLTDHTKQALSRAESGRQGLVLAFMSPEFQRR